MADWSWLTNIIGKAAKYEPLIKTGVAALSTYAAFKDQQKKTQLQQDAYDDYMKAAAAAGHEAQAAIDLNLTPMTVSGVPTTKADVTDFTAVSTTSLLSAYQLTASPAFSTIQSHTPYLVIPGLTIPPGLPTNFKDLMPFEFAIFYFLSV